MKKHYFTHNIVMFQSFAQTPFNAVFLGILSELFYIGNVLPLQWAQLTKTVHTARLGLSLSFAFLGCMIYLYVHVCFVLPWSVKSFPFVFWRWHNKLK